MSGATVVIESLDSYGQVRLRERFALSDAKRSFTIGRGVDADVTLDDEHAAALHASVEILPDGRVLASDLGSLNGIVAGAQRHHGVAGLELADGLLQVGRTRLRVRTARSSLAPEQLDQLRPASLLADPAWIAGAGAAMAGGQVVYNSWLGAPRDLAASAVTALATALLVVAVWVAFWGLLTRVMKGEWRWLRHAAILLGLAAIFAAVDGTLDLGWFMFSLPPWSSQFWWLAAVAIGAAIYLHLVQASSLSTRRAALIACLIPALVGGGRLWLAERSVVRDVNNIATRQRIFPPALRLSAADTMDNYFKRVTALREAADSRRKALVADEAAEDGK